MERRCKMKWKLSLLTFIIVSVVTFLNIPATLFGNSETEAAVEIDIGCAGKVTTFNFSQLGYDGNEWAYRVCSIEDCEECIGVDPACDKIDAIANGDGIIDSNSWSREVTINKPGKYCLWFHVFRPCDWPDGDVVCFTVEKCIEKVEPEEKVWVRDHEMECFKVWVNEDNNFEFVFWWVYKDNNHVHIYDMDGILVREIDFEKEKPHFEVELPDGMYTVKTFHEAGHILQEFVIGKP
jgi:hypothetical protein